MYYLSLSFCPLEDQGGEGRGRLLREPLGGPPMPAPLPCSACCRGALDTRTPALGLSREDNRIPASWGQRRLGTEASKHVLLLRCHPSPFGYFDHLPKEQFLYIWGASHLTTLSEVLGGLCSPQWIEKLWAAEGQLLRYQGCFAGEAAEIQEQIGCHCQ